MKNSDIRQEETAAAQEFYLKKKQNERTQISIHLLFTSNEEGADATAAPFPLVFRNCSV